MNEAHVTHEESHAASHCAGEVLLYTAALIGGTEVAVDTQQP